MSSLPIGLVLVIVTAHLIGDWHLQNDDMAVNKSRDNLVLTEHVVVVSGILLGFVALWAVVTHTNLWTVLAWALLNGMAHWVTDYFTSRRNGRNFFLDMAHPVKMITAAEGPRTLYPMLPNKRHVFFTGIGDDQWVHVVTLLTTAAGMIR